MTDRISAKDYTKLLQGKGRKSSADKKAPPAERMSSQQARASADSGMKESAVEALCCDYLAAHGWMTTHHDPFQQFGPPVRLSVAQAAALKAQGTHVPVFGGYVPTLLPIKPVQETDRAWPDRICIHPRAMAIILIEFKRLGEKPRPDQGQMLSSASFCAFYCDSLEMMITELTKRNLPGGKV